MVHLMMILPAIRYELLRGVPGWGRHSDVERAYCPIGGLAVDVFDIGGMAVPALKAPGFPRDRRAGSRHVPGRRARMAR